MSDSVIEARKERRRILARARYAKNPHKARAYAIAWGKKNPERKQLNRLQWAAANPEKAKAAWTKSRAKRYKSSPNFRLSLLLRGATQRLVVMGWKKTRRTSQYIGCSVDELRRHIEARFRPGMTWENHGYYGWHIDHIRPLASFDLSNPEQAAAALHYTNLQPLWALDNLRKRDMLQSGVEFVEMRATRRQAVAGY